LPADYSVSVREMQLFMKRLRRRFPGVTIRFYAVAEYGEKADATKRPHYHFILYGMQFPDAVPSDKSQRGLPQWQSEILSSLWGKGRTVIGEVGPHSISYVAGYIFEKLGGKLAEEAYSNRVHAVTGELCNVRPPFNLMSNKPGIGEAFWRLYQDSDAQGDFIVRDGKRRNMPRSVIRKRLEALPSDEAREAAKLARRQAIAEAIALLPPEENAQSRVLVKELCAVLRAKSLARADALWTEERIQEQTERAGEWARVERERGL
jgi:hypothetical protein